MMIILTIVIIDHDHDGHDYCDHHDPHNIPLCDHNNVDDFVGIMVNILISTIAMIVILSNTIMTTMMVMLIMIILMDDLGDDHAPSDPNDPS